MYFLAGWWVSGFCIFVFLICFLYIYLSIYLFIFVGGYCVFHVLMGFLFYLSFFVGVGEGCIKRVRRGLFGDVVLFCLFCFGGFVAFVFSLFCGFDFCLFVFDGVVVLYSHIEGCTWMKNDKNTRRI